LLQFQDLLCDLQVDKYVTANGIKPREEDPDIGIDEFKDLIQIMIA